MSQDGGADLYELDPNTLSIYQEKANATQGEFAAAMHMPLRTYEDIVAGRSKMRPVHLQAANFALLRIAQQKGDPAVITPALANLVRDLAKLIEAEPK